MQIGSRTPSEVGLVVGSRLYRIRRRRGSLVLPESPGSKQRKKAAIKTLDAAHATQRDRALPAHAPRPQDVL